LEAKRVAHVAPPVRIVSHGAISGITIPLSRKLPAVRSRGCCRLPATICYFRPVNGIAPVTQTASRYPDGIARLPRQLLAVIAMDRLAVT
jgi:hypothetical protein